MINAPFDRSDPRDTTRGGVSLAPHAKSSMGGAGMRNTKARGSVDGLVRTETILVKRLQSRQRTSFNAAELAVPKILHQMLCTTASDQVVAALGCGEREIVFAGSGGIVVPVIWWSQHRDGSCSQGVLRLWGCVLIADFVCVYNWDNTWQTWNIYRICMFFYRFFYICMSLNNIKTSVRRLIRDVDQVKFRHVGVLEWNWNTCIPFNTKQNIVQHRYICTTLGGRTWVYDL